MAANLKYWDGAAWRTITKVRRWDGVAWVELQRIRRWTLNAGDGSLSWKDVYIKGGTAPPPSPPPVPPPPPPPPPITLNVTANPSPATGSRTGVGVCSTPTVTISVSNGVAPYTYTFTRSSYTAAEAPTITQDPVNKNLVFFSQNLPNDPPQEESANFKCAVKDANGNIGSCSISVTWNSVVREGTGGSGYIPPKPF